jgi:hypothetical protein
MEEKFNKAIVAGVISGGILVILSFIYTIVWRLVFINDLNNWLDEFIRQSDTAYPIMPQITGSIIIALFILLILFALGVLTFFLAGVLAARKASEFIKNKNDAIMVGIVAGALAEVIHRPFAMVFSFIMDLVKPIASSYSGDTAVNAVISAGSQLICTFPIILIAGALLAMLGALAYAVLKLNV